MGGQIMKLFRLLLLIPFIVFSDADDMYLIKGGKTFLPDGSLAVKDILIDEGKIILVENNIGNVGAKNVINAEGKYITPGLIVFSSLGLLEIGALPQTNDTSSDIYNAGFDPSKAYNPFSQAVRLNRAKGVSSTVHVPGASGYFSGLLTYTKINDGYKQKKQGQGYYYEDQLFMANHMEILEQQSCILWKIFLIICERIKMTIMPI